MQMKRKKKKKKKITRLNAETAEEKTTKATRNASVVNETFEPMNCRNGDAETGVHGNREKLQAELNPVSPVERSCNPHHTRTMANAEGECMTFRDKKKFFEKEIEDHVTGKKPISERKFSYLQEHEVAKLKTEEERKKNTMSEEELCQYVQDKLVTDGTADYKNILISSSPLLNSNIARTVKPVWHSRENSFDSSTDPSDVHTNGHRIQNVQLSATDDRVIQAEKKTAWQKARMDSLVEDAIRAQAIIATTTKDLAENEVTNRGDPTVVNGNGNNLEDNQIRSYQTNGGALSVEETNGHK